MSNKLIVPNQQTNLAGYDPNIAAKFGLGQTSSFSQGIGGNLLPSLSIRGRTFRQIVKGVETSLNTQELAVVLVTARETISKRFYAGGYTPGSQDRPSCSSINGVTPDPNVTQRQAQTCGMCPQNIWGSKILPGGKQGKNCSDYKLIIVVSAAELFNGVPASEITCFQLQVPAASMKDLAQYNAQLNAHGIVPQAVVTLIKMADTEYPKLEFIPAHTLGQQMYLGESQLSIVAAAMQRPDVLDTIKHEQPAPAQPQPLPFQQPPVGQQPPAPQQPIGQPAPGQWPTTIPPQYAPPVASPAPPSPFGLPQPEAQQAAPVTPQMASQATPEPVPQQPVLNNPVAEATQSSENQLAAVIGKWKNKK